jgi:hypothetical protein
MLEAAATNVLADVLTRKARYVAALASRSPSDAVDSLYLLGDNSFRPVVKHRTGRLTVGNFVFSTHARTIDHCFANRPVHPFPRYAALNWVRSHPCWCPADSRQRIGRHYRRSLDREQGRSASRKPDSADSTLKFTTALTFSQLRAFSNYNNRLVYPCHGGSRRHRRSLRAVDSANSVVDADQVVARADRERDS